MSLGLLLVIVLIVVLIASLPRWPYSQGWGYPPSLFMALIVIIVIVALLHGGRL